jgi:hypothetical protein
VLIPCFLGGIGWTIVKGGQLVIQILQIEQQWQQAHPSEFVRPQTFYAAPDPVNASNQMTDGWEKRYDAKPETK